MTTIEINAGGRYVKVHQDGRDAETLLPLAQQAWEATDGAKHESDGPAFGFQTELRWTDTVHPLGHGQYGADKERGPVQAEVTGLITTTDQPRKAS